MVEISYVINQQLSNNIISQIAEQPGMTRSPESIVGGASITFWFDHTPEQAVTFKKFLNNLLGVNNEALSRYTNWDGGALIYTTDLSVTLTNIGTTFKNLYTVSDGLSFGFDSDNYDQIRLYVHWTRVGTGISTVQIVDVSNPSNILASIDIPTTGNSPFIGPWVNIPSILKRTTNKYVIQVKNTVAADDPVFLGIRVYAR